MAFTKQHYERVAKLARDYTILTQGTYSPSGTYDKPLVHQGFIHGLVDMFADDNPRFDRERFLLACGMHKDDI